MAGKDPIERVKGIVFILIHILALAGIFFVKTSPSLLLAATASYLVRMFAVTAGYHRYFSHRAFRTGRTGQFILAVIGCTAFQRGPLWWASHHRVHHRYTDQAGDPHSPVEKGFWWAHVGWLLSSSYDKTNEQEVRDFGRYPEILWINRNSILISGCFAVGTLAFGGLNLFYWVVILSTVAVWHATMSINSISHHFGSRRFETDDASRNNVWVAVITLGEGWHNNHHRFLSNASFSQAWWEVDVTYVVLRVLAFFRLVELKKTPRNLLEE